MSIQLMKEQIINNVQHLVGQMGFKSESEDEYIKVYERNKQFFCSCLNDNSETKSFFEPILREDID